MVITHIKTTANGAYTLFRFMLFGFGSAFRLSFGAFALRRDMVPQ